MRYEGHGESAAAAVSRRALLRNGRALIFGLAACALALYGQKLIGNPTTRTVALRYYAAGIVVAIIAWRATYRNKSLLLGASIPGTAISASDGTAGDGRGMRRAYAARSFIALIALGLNLYSVGRLRSHAYSDLSGAVGWLVSLAMLLAAYVGHRPYLPRRESASDDAEEQTDLRLPRWLEVAGCLGIFALAVALRLHRLGDWTTGLHGDEGEVGLDALRIAGNRISPFLAGWFEQPNFYYWGVALGMSLFGTDLFGLRMFSALAGSLMILPFYLLVRQLFGVRMAILASFFLAISDVAIHFSRQEFSNITTPLFLVVGFYFLFRGLSSGRTPQFVLAGYAHVLSMYFYLGGRLTPMLIAGFLLYLFVIGPLARLPIIYRDLRKRRLLESRRQTLSLAARLEAERLAPYLKHSVPVYAIAFFCFLTPWLAYYLDHRDSWNARVKEKIIFSQPDRMAQRYPVSHDPFYLGLRLPRRGDTLPLPIGFEKSPLSVRLTRDGFWPRVVWGQLTTTVSILTYRFDTSSVYTFSEPVAKPIEAALIVLGIAWALWRWRDTRMALLTIWFWSTVLVGGALTIDAPYMARLIGIIPVMAVFAATPLNKLAAEFVVVLGRRGKSRLGAYTGQFLSATGLAALLGFLTWQNYSDYYLRYLAAHPFRAGTGQAYFVRQMNAAVAAEHRPPPKYYSLGAHYMYWGYGVNRFLNRGTTGQDMANPSDELPIVDDREGDVVFMIWPNNDHYLPILKAYYPDGIESPFRYGPRGQEESLFVSYRVKKEELDARRVALATYSPARGCRIERRETGFGSSGTLPPAGLIYPAQVHWDGGLVAPGYGPYRFEVKGPAGSNLFIDAERVLTTGRSGQSETEAVLARGLHEVSLRGTLPSSEGRIELRWAAADAKPVAIARGFLWSGPGRALSGEIRGLENESSEHGKGRPPLQRRIDGFLGFRDAAGALAHGQSIVGVWTGTFAVRDRGDYQFGVVSHGTSTISIDGKIVVDNRHAGNSPQSADARVTLEPGEHRFKLQYVWTSDVGYLEVYWTPPGRGRSMLGLTSLRTEGGVWSPDRVSE
jgi:hypothetical protein